MVVQPLLVNVTLFVDCEMANNAFKEFKEIVVEMPELVFLEFAERPAYRRDELLLCDRSPKRW